MNDLNHQNDKLRQIIPIQQVDISQIHKGVEKKIKGILENNSFSFRRNMFLNKFPPEINQKLDYISLNFIRFTRFFDEIVLLKINNDGFEPVYSFSLRNKKLPNIDISDFQEIANNGKDLNNGEWKYYTQEEGSSFDMVGKISNSFLLCINNTVSSITELEESDENWVFEIVKPHMDKTIQAIKAVGLDKY